MNTKEPSGPQARTTSSIIKACDILDDAKSSLRLLFLAATGEALEREDQHAFTFAAGLAASKVDEACAMLEEVVRAEREVAA